MYRAIKSQEKYFSTWELNQIDTLTEELKIQIYGRYVLKCDVFQRDEFSCQNVGCKFKDSPLTIHHVKFRKNGGKDTTRNSVTVCRTCHTAFHRAKRGLTFPEREKLPTHIRGKVFQVNKKLSAVDWKKLRAGMKAIRKELNQTGKITKAKDLTMEHIILLMIWLNIPYDEFDD